MQRDLFRGDTTLKRLKEIKKENIDRISRDRKGKVRTLFGYIKAVEKSKQKENKEEKQEAELGGQEYWNTFRR